MLSSAETKEPLNGQRESPNAGYLSPRSTTTELGRMVHWRPRSSVLRSKLRSFKRRGHLDGLILKFLCVFGRQHR